MPNGFQGVFAAPFQSWLSDHPAIAWMVAHPLWTVGLLFVVLLMTWGLLGAIARFIQEAWLAILQVPLRLAQFLFRGTFRLFLRAAPSQASLPESAPQNRMNEILSRLEAIHQEEEALMKEMRSLLESKAK